MVGSGAGCLPHRRLPDGAHADTNPTTGYADKGSSQRGLRTAPAHTDSYTYSETHRYTLPAANGHADPDSSNGNADPHRNAISTPANTRRYVDPDPAYRDNCPHGNTQATHAHTHECLPFSGIPSGPARSFPSLSQLSKGTSLYRGTYHRRRRLSSGRCAAGVL